ncbi:DUF1579 domain-containing protein [Sphingomonas sp. KR3-1]|uniref:DUF1579 domain-containing protein n=1 Tax=Sphingomonas sp. KR3-1 TaxID=3156611 RepID=UPI0032B5C0D6
MGPRFRGDDVLRRAWRALASVILLAFAAPLVAHAQAADTTALAAQGEAMHKLDWMHGIWRGEARVRAAQGELVVTHTERAGTMLGGTVTVVEGKSYGADGTVPFNAFAVIAFDARAGTYSMQSYAGGRAGNFPMTVTDRGYAWEMPAGPGAKVQYSATFDGTTWTETGIFVAGGQPPRPFFKMALKRIGDTDWPAGGGVTRD